MENIAYKEGYKYQLHDEYIVKIPIVPEQNIDTSYIKLSPDGLLSIMNGYAWDGPSGPTYDSLNFMRGSLVHDALYQLMRGEFLDNEKYRKPADRLLQEMCKQDGMSSLRAWLVYKGVRFGGDVAADPRNKKPVVKAPGE